MEKIEWHIKNQNAKYKFSENLSKESSINISKEIFEFLGAKNSGDIVTVTLRKKDFLLAFSKLISNLPLYYYRNGSQKADFESDFFEQNYKEIEEHFGESERLQYQIKLRINDESTTRYYLYRMDGAKNFILRDFLIGENSILNFIKNDDGEIVIEPVIEIIQLEKSNNIKTDLQNAPNNFTPTQLILYGVPGSGKSYTIKNLLAQNKISAENTMRVVFHPEYTNSDFIGQILPKLKKNESGENVIDYQFTAGPFTQILRKAYCNPDSNFALIIEEINRGNAAAIFGELFQLLDRLDEDDTESYNGVTYTKGWSSYGVHNDCINAYFSGLYDNEGSQEKQPAIHFDLHSAIRLPSNLSLFATMNTSDQNVFSLDNAFKRRWDLKLIPNKFVFDSKDTKENKKHFDQCFAKVEDFDFTWGAFVLAVNSKIVGEQSGDDISSFEDKQIGMWFVKAPPKEETGEKIIKKEIFMHKVIEYLFDDVFKLDSSILFSKASLAELIEIADGDNPKSIFASGIVSAIESEQIELEKLKERANLG